MSKLARAVRDPKLLVVLLLGFSSGLPFLLIGATLKGYAFKSGVSLATVGYFSFSRLPYSLKFLWAPFLDRFGVGSFGRRRGWMLVSQLGLVVSLLALTQVDPVTQVPWLFVCALMGAFFGATQDIAIDAYRREILPNEELGLGSSLAVLGYRFGLLLAGAGAFVFADVMPWPMVYAVMAAFMGVGVLTAFFCPEPRLEVAPPRTLRESVVGPLVEFFGRPGAWTIICFILFYKVGESLASEMYNTFFIAMGFSNTEIGTVTKLFGIWATIGGGLVGGAAMVKLGLYRSLWIFGILQSVALLLFSVLALVGPSVPMLGLAIGSENFTSGMATSAYIAFMAVQSNRRFTAVQYALLTSLMSLPSTLLGGFTGHAATMLGWALYFVVCTALTVPGLLLLLRVRPLLDETRV